MWGVEILKRLQFRKKCFLINIFDYYCIFKFGVFRKNIKIVSNYDFLDFFYCSVDLKVFVSFI